ncbi:MAG TPA: glutaredoxin family protein [Pyrinomonadaceae bacterium]|jgi:glutaredoxin|nr:glutaredoxin family protein [Pyrinomonadaceae bacterium]
MNTIDEQPNTTDGQPGVTLYVVPNCPLCADARAWLARHGIPYAERDAAADFGAFRAMYKAMRQRLVPVFEKGGRALVRPTDVELSKFLL